MPNLIAIRNKIDQFLPVLRKLQSGYASRPAQVGKFHQILKTNSVPPQAQKVPDNINAVAGSHSESFADMIADPDGVLSPSEKAAANSLLNAMDTSLEVHTIERSDRNRGDKPRFDWKAVHTVDDNGTVMRLAYLGSDISSGKLPDRAQWEEVTKEVV